MKRVTTAPYDNIHLTDSVRQAQPIHTGGMHTTGMHTGGIYTGGMHATGSVPSDGTPWVYRKQASAPPATTATSQNRKSTNRTGTGAHISTGTGGVQSSDIHGNGELSIALHTGNTGSTGTVKQQPVKHAVPVSVVSKSGTAGTSTSAARTTTPTGMATPMALPSSSAARTTTATTGTGAAPRVPVVKFEEEVLCRPPRYAPDYPAAYRDCTTERGTHTTGTHTTGMGTTGTNNNNNRVVSRRSRRGGSAPGENAKMKRAAQMASAQFGASANNFHATGNDTGANIHTNTGTGGRSSSVFVAFAHYGGAATARPATATGAGVYVGGLWQCEDDHSDLKPVTMRKERDATPTTAAQQQYSTTTTAAQQQYSTTTTAAQQQYSTTTSAAQQQYSTTTSAAQQQYSTTTSAAQQQYSTTTTAVKQQYSTTTTAVKHRSKAKPAPTKKRGTRAEVELRYSGKPAERAGHTGTASSVCSTSTGSASTGSTSTGSASTASRSRNYTRQRSSSVATLDDRMTPKTGAALGQDGVSVPVRTGGVVVGTGAKYSGTGVNRMDAGYSFDVGRSPQGRPSSLTMPAHRSKAYMDLDLKNENVKAGTGNNTTGTYRSRLPKLDITGVFRKQSSVNTTGSGSGSGSGSGCGYYVPKGGSYTATARIEASSGKSALSQKYRRCNTFADMHGLVAGCDEDSTASPVEKKTVHFKESVTVVQTLDRRTDAQARLKEFISANLPFNADENNSNNTNNSLCTGNTCSNTNSSSSGAGNVFFPTTSCVCNTNIQNVADCVCGAGGIAVSNTNNTDSTGSSEVGISEGNTNLMTSSFYVASANNSTSSSSAACSAAPNQHSTSQYSKVEGRLVHLREPRNGIMRLASRNGPTRTYVEYERNLKQPLAVENKLQRAAGCVGVEGEGCRHNAAATHKAATTGGGGTNTGGGSSVSGTNTGASAAGTTSRATTGGTTTNGATGAAFSGAVGATDTARVTAVVGSQLKVVSVNDLLMSEGGSSGSSGSGEQLMGRRSKRFEKDATRTAASSVRRKDAETDNYCDDISQKVGKLHKVTSFANVENLNGSDDTDTAELQPPPAGGSGHVGSVKQFFATLYRNNPQQPAPIPPVQKQASGTAAVVQQQKHTSPSTGSPTLPPANLPAVPPKSGAATGSNTRRRMERQQNFPYLSVNLGGAEISGNVSNSNSTAGTDNEVETTSRFRNTKLRLFGNENSDGGSGMTFRMMGSPRDSDKAAKIIGSPRRTSSVSDSSPRKVKIRQLFRNLSFSRGKEEAQARL